MLPQYAIFLGERQLSIGHTLRMCSSRGPTLRHKKANWEELEMRGPLSPEGVDRTRTFTEELRVEANRGGLNSKIVCRIS